VNVREDILNILSDLGITVNDLDMLEQIDSVEFMTLIVTLEDFFGITFQDEMVLFSVMDTVSKIEIIVNNMLDDI